MRALSLWQPWASLMDFGAKKNETRGWSTTYRGPLLICATKRFDDEQLAIASQPTFMTALQRAQAYPFSFHSVRLPTPSFGAWLCLPTGVALCVVDLVDCIPITAEYERSLSAGEQAFGNYDLSRGPRWAWVTRNLQRLDAPIRTKGAQGLWSVSPDLQDEVERHLVQTCKHCGCTEAAACPGGCSWATQFECSSCIGHIAGDGGSG